MAISLEQYRQMIGPEPDAMKSKRETVVARCLAGEITQRAAAQQLHVTEFAMSILIKKANGADVDDGEVEDQDDAHVVQEELLTSDGEWTPHPESGPGLPQFLRPANKF